MELEKYDAPGFRSVKVSSYTDFDREGRTLQQDISPQSLTQQLTGDIVKTTPEFPRGSVGANYISATNAISNGQTIRYVATLQLPTLVSGSTTSVTLGIPDWSVYVNTSVDSTTDILNIGASSSVLVMSDWQVIGPAHSQVMTDNYNVKSVLNIRNISAGSVTLIAAVRFRYISSQGTV